MIKGYIFIKSETKLAVFCGSAACRPAFYMFAKSLIIAQSYVVVESPLLPITCTIHSLENELLETTVI